MTEGARDAGHEVVVIGAGWAGLSAAVHLTDYGLRPLLVDAAPQPGGRARGLMLELAGRHCEVDNGQHLMIGAYTETLALIERVARDRPAIRRAPMRLAAVDGLLIKPAKAPPPWDLLGGLLRAKGLTWRERWSLIRALASLRLKGWQVRPELTVSAWLKSCAQPTGLIERFWLPLCVATLNTPPETACAQTFAHVLRDSLGTSSRACEFVLPTHTLDDVIPQPACDWLLAHDVVTQLRQPVRAVHRDPSDGSWIIDGDGNHGGESDRPLRARQIVLAIPPTNALRVLTAGGHGETAERYARLGDFRYEPIVTVYMAWPCEISLAPWIMLSEQSAMRYFGQWLFDRGEQQGMRLGAVVVSARGRAWLAAEDRDDRVQTIARQVATQLNLPMPLDARAIVDKRATFCCTCDRPRLHADTLEKPLPGLWLAGDHVWPDYPATLEAAVRSGRRAAQLCAQRALSRGDRTEATGR